MSATPYETLDTQYTIEFGKEVHVLAQENMTKLMPFVKMANFDGGEDFAYDRFGLIADQKITQRFQPITLTDASWDRRWVAPEFFAVAVGIDQKDIHKMKRNPSRELVEGCVNAMMRRRDRIIYESAFADARVGKSGASASAVTFAQDGGVTIDATGGFGLSTLRAIKKKFVDNAVATDTEVSVALTVDGTRLDNLMQETQLVSFDYNTEKPLVKGTMGQAYGTQLIPFASGVQDPLLKVASAERNLLALAEGGIIFAGGVVSIRIEERIDMFNKPTQIVVEMCACAMRTEGVRAQKVRVAA